MRETVDFPLLPFTSTASILLSLESALRRQGLIFSGFSGGVTLLLPVESICKKLIGLDLTSTDLSSRSALLVVSPMTGLHDHL